MIKKLSSILLITALVLSLTAVMALPVSAAHFSSANWVQYERGLYTSTSSFKECFKEYANTSYGDDQLTAVKMVASTGTALSSNKNPVAYKFGENSAHYGSRENSNATYAHMRFYLASYSDEYRKATNKLQLRIDKDGTGSSREHYYFDTWVPPGRSDNCTSVYPCNYTASTAYVTKDWFDIVHQGRAGNGPASTVTANSQDTELTAGDYDKIDLIMEYNKQNGATSYLFANGKFMGSYYDSGLTDKHFHGIVIRILASSGDTRSIRNNSDYVAMKFDSDRIGHREYYNTDDYMVTFEDVMNDAGLGDSVDSSIIMFKTSEVQSFMPGNEQTAYTFEKDASARARINENVTYSGNTATITVTNTDTENYAKAASMLAGVYPVNGKTGVSYESYHPRAKFFKFSFDQTISDDGMWLEYATRYSGSVRAMQMWNNGGNLVVGIKGGSNITCNGSGNKPLASMTGTNHIDWILEPSESQERMNEYIYVNGKLAGEGYFGTQYVVRLNDIILSTMKSAGTVTIDNWNMTVYNEEATLEDINAEMAGDNIVWGSGDYELGYEKSLDGTQIAIIVTAKATSGYTPSASTTLYTALYNADDELIDVEKSVFVDGRTYADETETNIFPYSTSPAIKPVKARLFIWDGMTPQVHVKQINID